MSTFVGTLKDNDGNDFLPQTHAQLVTGLYDKDTSQPVGGMLPNVLYELGTLTGTVTFTLDAGISGKINHYYWTFETGSTAPTITWPVGITSWQGGSIPLIGYNKHYEVSVLNGVGICMEV